MNIIHNFYGNLFSFKTFFVYFMKEKKKTLNNISNSSCSGRGGAGDGRDKTTVGHPLSGSLLPAAPAIRTTSYIQKHEHTRRQRLTDVFKQVLATDHIYTAPGSEEEATSGNCFTYRGLGSTESDKWRLFHTQ
jgi:hypothetical protein